MTALSDIKSIADLINFIWERDKFPDLFLDELSDISKEEFTLIDSDKDGRLTISEIARYRHLPLNGRITIYGSNYLPLQDTQLCGIPFKRQELFEMGIEGSCRGVLARDIRIGDHTYKANTVIVLDLDRTVEYGTRIDATTVGTEPNHQRSTMNFVLLQDARLNDRHVLEPPTSGSTTGKQFEMILPAGTYISRDELGAVSYVQFTPDASIRFNPLGSRFEAAMRTISFKENETAEVWLKETMRVPVKRIIERIGEIVPLSIRTLVNFLPTAMVGLRTEELKRNKDGGHMTDVKPLSPKDLVLKILDSDVRELNAMMGLRYDASGKPIEINLIIDPFSSQPTNIALRNYPMPTSMPYFDEILKIIDEELAAANPLPEVKTTAASESHADAPAIAVSRPAGNAPSPLPNLRLDASYLVGRGQRPGVEVEAGFKAVGIGGEYARVIPSGDAAGFNEWRANARLRLELLPVLGTQFFTGARGRDDGESSVGLEVGAKASAMFTSNWLIDLSPSYTIMKGADILDLGGGLGYRSGSIGASLGYRALLTDGQSSHGPRAGLFVWF